MGPALAGERRLPCARSPAVLRHASSACSQAYGLAVGVSCGIAVGARKLIESGPPAVKKLGIAVPYAAVVCAGGANVAFTRLPEMQTGVPIADEVCSDAA